MKFALEWEKRWDAGEGRMNLAELCREFGISREPGYVWLRRCRAAGPQVEALEERSHRPYTMPYQIPQDVGIPDTHFWYTPGLHRQATVERARRSKTRILLGARCASRLACARLGQRARASKCAHASGTRMP